MAGLPDFKALHREAFKTAYDYLDKCFPFEWNDQWVEKKTTELLELSRNANENENDLLKSELFLSLKCYLEKVLSKWNGNDALPDFNALHKKAFRAALDYLNKYWPPVWDDAWWKERAKELGLMYSTAEKANNNLLESELYLAVFCYMEKALKKWWPEEDVV